MKNTLGFFAFVAVVLGLLYLVSGTKSPRIPDDELHVVFDRTDFCLDCHGPDGRAPRKSEHPPKDECLKCHHVKRNRARR